MNRSARPRISIVLPTDTFATIIPVVRHLEGLALGEDVEVVVVIPRDEAGVGLDSSLERVVIKEVASVYPLAGARAAGIRASTSSFVFMGETHSFPCEAMFAQLLRAHESGYGIAVPVFENGNPDGVVSWAGFINGYGPWTAGRQASEISYAPLFNCSYQRQFLVSLGPDLPHLLRSGEDLMQHVRSAGLRVWLEPAARIAHVNMTDFPSWMKQRVVAGRVIASVRAERWSWVRRLAFAVGAPLIPAVLMTRHRRGIMRTITDAGLSPRVVIILGIGMIAQALGELSGYLLGESPAAARKYDEYEIRQLLFARRD